MKILVIGAGNTGCAATAFLSRAGHEVLIYTRSREKAGMINENGLEATGEVSGRFHPTAVWRLDQAVPQVSFIFIFTTADAHVTVFEQLKPLVGHNHTLVVFNSNWGAYQAGQILETKAGRQGCVVAETGAMPFIAAVDTVCRVDVKSIKQSTTISSLKPEQTDSLVDCLGDILPGLVPASDVVATSISATNPVIHVPVCLFNLARVENKERFRFYGQGVSQGVVETITRLDSERIAIADRLGVRCDTVLDTLNSFWPDKFDTLYDALVKNASYENVMAPQTLEHRYFYEDIPYGIVPIVHLGDALDIETPCADAVVAAACLYLNKDYLEQGVCPDINQLKKYTGKRNE